MFSVFECIEPDMQIKDNHNVFDFTDKGKSEEKVYYTENVMTLNEDFISDPMSNFKIPDYENNLDDFRFINTKLYNVPEKERDIYYRMEVVRAVCVNCFLIQKILLG